MILPCSYWENAFGVCEKETVLINEIFPTVFLAFLFSYPAHASVDAAYNIKAIPTHLPHSLTPTAYLITRASVVSLYFFSLFSDSPHFTHSLAVSNLVESTSNEESCPLFLRLSSICLLSRPVWPSRSSLFLTRQRCLVVIASGRGKSLSVRISQATFMHKFAIFSKSVQSHSLSISLRNNSLCCINSYFILG